MDANSRNGPNPAGEFEVWLTTRRFAIALAVLVLARYADLLFLGKTLVARDFGLFGYPLACFQRECFMQGALPFWNPYNSLGIPFLAQWNTAVLYPPGLIYLLLPLTWGINAFCVAHIYLGGLGMFLLARRATGSPLAGAVASVAFAFGGMTQNCLMSSEITAGVAWMPWVVLTMERLWAAGSRRDLAWASLAGTMQMLAGPPDLVFITWVGVVVLGLGRVLARESRWWPALLRTTVAICLITALSAPQLLPFFQLVGESSRDSGYNIGGWEMPWSGFGHLVVPLFGYRESVLGPAFQSGQGFTSSFYNGILTLALAGLAIGTGRGLRVRLLAVLAVVFYFLALGDAGGLYTLVRKVFPPVGMMRYPVKFTFLTNLLLPLLAAHGLKQCLDLARGGALALLKDRLAAAGAILAATALVLIGYTHSGYYHEEAALPLVSGITRLVLLGAGLWVIWRIARGVRHPVAWAAALPALVAVDLLTHMPHQNPTAPAAVFTPGRVSIPTLAPRPTVTTSRAAMSLSAYADLQVRTVMSPEDRYLQGRAALLDDANILDRTPVLAGHFALYLRREQDLTSLFYRTGAFPEGLADALAISHVSLAENPLEWQVRSNCLPVIHGGQAPVFLPESDLLEALLDPDLDLHNRVLLDERDAPALASARPGSVEICEVAYRPNHIAFSATAAQPSVATLAFAAYPCWQARVNGSPAPLYRANHAFQAVLLQAGDSRVELAYHDSQFIIGCWLALAGLLTCAVLVATGRRGREREVPPETPACNKDSRQS